MNTMLELNKTMKTKLFFSVVAFLIIFNACKKENSKPDEPKPYIKATINGKEVVFNDFMYLGWKAERQGQSQIIRATSQKGETPVRQLYCMIYGPNDGLNKLNRNSTYDKVRVYYSEGLENYAAWEGVKNSTAEFMLDSVKRTSSAYVPYKSGTFNAKVFNKQKDSILITNGSYKFF